MGISNDCPITLFSDLKKNDYLPLLIFSYAFRAFEIEPCNARIRILIAFVYNQLQGLLKRF